MAVSSFGKSQAPAKGAGAGGRAASSDIDLKAVVPVVATVCYTNGWEKDEKSDAYGGLFVVEPGEPTYQNLKDLVAAHAEALTGQPELGPRHHNPLREGDEIGTNGGFAFKDPFFRGKKVFRAKSKFAPTFMDSDQNLIDASMVCGGDRVVVEIQAYNFNNQSAGVAFSLGGIMLLEKGDRVIERGGSSGSALKRFDLSGVKFKKPGNDGENV